MLISSLHVRRNRLSGFTTSARVIARTVVPIPCWVSQKPLVTRIPTASRTTVAHLQAVGEIAFRRHPRSHGEPAVQYLSLDRSNDLGDQANLPADGTESRL